MQVTLFNALKSIKVGDDQATAVVEQLEEFMALKIKEANAALEAQNKALESKIEQQQQREKVGRVVIVM